MAAVKVFNKEGAEQGEVAIADELLDSSRGGQAVHDAVVEQHGNLHHAHHDEERGNGGDELPPLEPLKTPE